ncbi:MAG: exosortase C-terminal domain/associated protein EpsI [Methylophilaceae bacterium]
MHSSAIKMMYLPIRSSLIVCALLILAAALSVLVTPTYKELAKPPVLEDVVPLKLGEWENRPSPYAQVSVNTFTQAISDAIYDQVLMRTYEDKAGSQVMLALAFAGEQRQEIKIHQPEVCYPAQGYQMLAIKDHVFNIPSYPFPINGKQLIFKKDNRLEAVSYWIRLGNSFPSSGMEMRLRILKEGLKGNLDDGVLVRVSSIINQESDAPAAYALHEKFLTDVVAEVGKSTPNLIVPIKH